MHGLLKYKCLFCRSGKQIDLFVQKQLKSFEEKGQAKQTDLTSTLHVLAKPIIVQSSNLFCWSVIDCTKEERLKNAEQPIRLQG